jgi:signal transduction histidine kinase
MDLSWIERRLYSVDDPEQRAELMDKTRAMGREIDESIQAVRKISTQLRPRILDDLGLIGAIEWQTQDFENRTGVHCDIGQTELDAVRLDLDPQRSTAVFRIFQEILTNVRRHSGAGHVRIDLHSEGEKLILEVTDDGKGMSLEDPTWLNGLGILGMRERAQVFGGNVSVESEHGKGTSVRVVIPLSSGV